MPSTFKSSVPWFRLTWKLAVPLIDRSGPPGRSGMVRSTPPLMVIVRLDAGDWDQAGLPTNVRVLPLPDVSTVLLPCPSVNAQSASSPATPVPSVASP